MFWLPITRLCEDEGRIVRIPLTETTMIIPGGRIEDFHGMQILSLVYGPDRILGIAIKRLLDIVIATAALIVFSPLLLILGALIWLQDGRPILFHQDRVGTVIQGHFSFSRSWSSFSLLM